MNPRSRRISITAKFIAYLVLISIIPLVVVGLVSYRLSYSVVLNEAERYTLELVTNQRDYLDLHLEQIESLLTNISGVEEIRNALEAKGETTDDYTNLATQAQIGYILNNYSNLRGLVSIDIFTINGAHYHVGDTLNINNIRTDVRDNLFQEAMNNNGLVAWVGIIDNVNLNSRNTKVVTAAKILNQINRDTLEQSPVALFLVNYSVNDLYNHFNQVQLGEDAYLLVLDGQNRFIYHPDPALLGQAAPMTLVNQMGAARGVKMDWVDGQQMSVSYVRSEMSGWTIISLAPVKTLTAESATIRNTTLIILLLSFFIVGISGWFYNRDVVHPIREITQRFQLLPDGPLDGQPALIHQGDDEIAELVQWFNAFVESLAARQQAEAQVQASLREKEALLREIHHRVKNNLQIISSLLNLQSSHVKDPASLRIFQDSQDRIRSMALIHEKLYQSQNLAQVDFAEYIRNLVVYLTSSLRVGADKITVHTDLATLFLGIDKAVPCGLILNELISNVFKHAFPGDTTGVLTVRMQVVDETAVLLLVQDNGVGLPADIELRANHTLGLQLIHTLVKQISGSVEFAPDNGSHGLTVMIHFPLAAELMAGSGG